MILHEKRKQKTIRWSLVAVNMLVIFLFSSQTGTDSGELSGFVAAVIENIPMAGLALQYINIRKLAHFSIYMLLGIFTVRAVMLHSSRRLVWILAALGICFLYACTDEYHQSFVPGRGPSFKDVLIDTAGALTGIATVMVAKMARR